MKTSTIIRLAAALFVVALFNACTTSPVEPEKEPWEKIVIENAKNPEDNWGKQHNLGLDAIALKLQGINLAGKDTAKVILQLVLDYSKTQPSQYQDASKTVDELDAVTNFDPERPYLMDSLSASGQNLFRELIIQMNKFKPDIDIVTFQNEVMALENKILNQASVQDRNYLLKSGAIARYSSAYWYAEFQKVLISNDLNASLWQKYTKTLYTNGRIESSSASNPPKKDPGGSSMPGAIGASARGIR
jgi:hypothetical protein